MNNFIITQDGLDTLLIEKLLNNPELRRKLSENVLEDIKKYEWNKIIQEFEDIYSEVMYKNNKE